MVRTHLPQHMDSVREKLRPKHQLLISKCYPRLPKNSAADVRPNGSELSYLLYYASTRRSKLQKVGAFLERRTASDVSHSQSARVTVTMQILTAMLENKVIGSGSAFGLIAPYILRIIAAVLGATNDVGLVEACLPTWHIFCQRQDQATLAADHEYRALYETVVRQWTAYAQKSPSKSIGKSSSAVSVPDAIRLRKAGLAAVDSILSSDSLSPEIGRQLNHAIPAILTNLCGGDALSLTHLLALSKRGQDEDKDKQAATTRRYSMATTRTYTGNESAAADPRAAEGTAQDADELAEEETAVMAVDCLKTVFDTDNRSQVRLATSQLLSFLAREQRSQNAQVSGRPANAVDWTSWSTKLFETITTWTPVQERFIVLVTATETLVRLPLTPDHAPQHLLISQLVDNVLRSDLNLIGLSVMDILLGFIQQILRVLQMGPPAAPTPGDTITTDFATGAANNPNARKPSVIPQQTAALLLARLKSCMSDLATHVYYTDQITDMIAAILLRLKPNASQTNPSNPAATAAAIQEPATAVSDNASRVSLVGRERSQNAPVNFFSFDAARQIALEAVKEIILVANSSRSKASGGVAESRNLVSLSVWEGTQWLLRDPAPNVRRAYVDALCTWLVLETRRSDARIQEPKPVAKNSRGGNGNGNIARRALSNASSKERTSKKARNTFLQLLHLAVFENALQHAATSDPDILLLHLLMSTMAPRLGVNAVQSALPMILALQEEIPKVYAPLAKIRIGSLVHGYFWQLSEQYELSNDPVGRDISFEITRRKQHGMWMNGLSVPATQLDRIPLAGDGSSNASKFTLDSMQNEALRPLDRRQELVDRIADGYLATVTSPAPSNPASPGRMSTHSLDRNASSYLSVKQTPSPALPDKVRAAMMATWTKEGCLAAIAVADPKTTSVSGSRSSPSQQVIAGNHRQLLAAINQGSPRSDTDKSNDRPSPSPPLAHGQHLGITNNSNANRRHSPQNYGLGAQPQRPQDPARRPSGSQTGARGSSVDGAPRPTLKIEALKRVLASGSSNAVAHVGRFDMDDSDSESMVGVDDGDDDLASDAGFSTASVGPRNAAAAVAAATPGPGGKAPAAGELFRRRMNGSVTGSVSGKSSVYSVAASRAPSVLGPNRKNLAALLDGIDLGERSEPARRFGAGRPPY